MLNNIFTFIYIRMSCIKIFFLFYLKKRARGFCTRAGNFNFEPCRAKVRVFTSRAWLVPRLTPHSGVGTCGMFSLTRLRSVKLTTFRPEDAYASLQSHIQNIRCGIVILNFFFKKNDRIIPIRNTRLVFLFVLSTNGFSSCE